MSNRIQELIALLEEEIEQSPKPRLGNVNKRIVDCDRILDILGDIKVVLPEEIRVAQTVLIEREALLIDAEERATSIMAEARINAEHMIARDEIVKHAKEQADQLIKNAEENADAITTGARNYAQEILEDIQRYLHEYIEIVGNSREELSERYGKMQKKGRIRKHEDPENKGASASEDAYSHKKNLDENQDQDDSEMCAADDVQIESNEPAEFDNEDVIEQKTFESEDEDFAEFAFSVNVDAH